MIKTKQVCSTHQVIHKEGTAYPSCETQSKHTPGPWEVRINPKGGWNIGDLSGNTSLATVRDHWSNAAPELLEAAKDYLADLESNNGTWTKERLKATITKAERK